jgi:hypothetical protein
LIRCWYIATSALEQIAHVYLEPAYVSYQPLVERFGQVDLQSFFEGASPLGDFANQFFHHVEICELPNDLLPAAHRSMTGNQDVEIGIPEIMQLLTVAIEVAESHEWLLVEESDIADKCDAILREKQTGIVFGVTGAERAQLGVPFGAVECDPILEGLVSVAGLEFGHFS